MIDWAAARIGFGKRLVLRAFRATPSLLPALRRMPGRLRELLGRLLAAVRGMPAALRELIRRLTVEQFQRRCAVVALVAGLLASLLGLSATLLRPSNEANADTAATAGVAAALRDPLAKVLTYDYADMERTHRAAKRLFAGSAVQQYDGLFDRIRHGAVQQRLVVTTLVRRLGVVRLRGEDAELLAFVDQQILAGRKQQRSGTAQLSLQAHHGAHGWRITRISVL